MAAAGTRKRLSVVTLVDGLGLAGGGERFAYELTLRLDPERFDRTFCVSRWSEAAAREPGAAELLARLEESGARFLGLERRGRLDLAAWRPLLAALREQPVDILHGHKFGSNAWAAILGTLARTPVIVAHEQTWSFEGQPLRRFLDRELIARRASAVIAVSSADRRRMVEIEGIDPEKIVLVLNRIPDPPPPTGVDLREQLGISKQAPVLGTVAGLRAQKRLDVLAHAAARVRERFPDLRVLVAGEGPERPHLEALIGELGLGETMTLLGRRGDVPDLLRALEVAVLSSDYEGSPLAVMEYMEAARPIVATRVGAVPDLIDDGVHGLLVESGDPNALAAAIVSLLDDRERAREMGERARERRRAEFGIDVTVRRIADLYAVLCERVNVHH